MVTQDQVRQFATKYQTSELNVMREYLHHLFLSYFYEQPQTSEIYFKGGTALRIVYQSARFSEDLDFSTNRKDVPGIEDCLLEVLAEIEKENVAATLREAKTTTGGYLSTIDFVLFGQIVPVQIEISFREKGNTGELITLASDFIPPYTAVILAKDLLVAEKIRALLARKKPRDFYDLYFILRKNLLPPTQKSILSEVLKALETTDINFDNELKQFLPKSQWAIIRDFKTALEGEINRFL